MSLDLGEDDILIEDITLWNKTNCCDNRMKDVYIVVSDYPITGSTLAEAQLSSGSGTYHFGTGRLGDDATMDINRTGRYIRIFNREGHKMNLVEIEVWGQGPGI